MERAPSDTTIAAGNSTRLRPFGVVVALAALLALWPSIDGRAQSVESKTSIVGAWTLNKDLSDQVGNGDQSSSSGGSSGSNRSGGSGGGYGRGGGGGGHHGGGGMGRGGGGNSVQAMDPDQAARMRDAMRDLTGSSQHLTITKTDSLVVITGADGRTTRLSPDGKKIKDDNTKVERKTKWDGDKLVSEINGIGKGKATQSFVVDPETHQLRIVVLMDNGSGQPRTITHVYDFDALTR